MTVSSLAGDIIVSTCFFVLTMYGSIMGGSGQVKMSENGDLNMAMGVTNTERGEVDGQGPQVEPKPSQPLHPTEESEATNLTRYT